MIYIIILAIIISVILISLLRGGTPTLPYRGKASSSMHRLGELPTHREDQIAVKTEDLAAFRNLSLENLEEFCQKLIAHHGLTFKAVEQHGNAEFHMLTVYDKPLLRGNVILCGYLTDTGVVNSETVIGFSDMVKAERAMKGIFMTNGFFSEEVMKLNEGASMELIDVSQLAQLMTELTPQLLPQPIHRQP